jgi:single stranded DNA-binding protein (ssb)
LANLNQIYLLGNLTRDPELRYTNEGMAIAEMGMAVNKRWKDANGDENSVVDFFNITVWNHLAENCAGSLKKGDRIMICGHLNLRSWENKDGKKYNIVNITADVAALSLEFNKANNHESRPDRTNSSEDKPDRTDYSNGSDKTDISNGKPEGKIKKKDLEKKQDSVSAAQDLAADYSLEVISR